MKNAMNLDRRGLIQFALPVLAGGSALIVSPVVQARPRRITQGELSAAITKHSDWLEGIDSGARADFANCDLSGLDLGGADGSLVNLRGADFTEADMTGIAGRLVSFNYASLHGARLSWSRLTDPAFICASLRKATCNDVVWGVPIPAAFSRPVKAGECAVMFHTDAAQSDFSNAILAAHICEARFTGARLIAADFSRSVFFGDRDSTSFFRADLTRATFAKTARRCARFSQANLTDTDFSADSLREAVES